MNLIGNNDKLCSSMDIEEGDTISEVSISYEDSYVNMVTFKTVHGDYLPLGKIGKTDKLVHLYFAAGYPYKFFGLTGSSQVEGRVNSLGVIRYDKICYHLKAEEIGDTFSLS